MIWNDTFQVMSIIGTIAAAVTLVIVICSRWGD